jgi:hypothetical protein
MLVESDKHFSNLLTADQDIGIFQNFEDDLYMHLK